MATAFSKDSMASVAEVPIRLEGRGRDFSYVQIEIATGDFDGGYQVVLDLCRELVDSEENFIFVSRLHTRQNDRISRGNVPDGGADAEPLPSPYEVSDDNVFDLRSSSDPRQVDRVVVFGIELTKIPKHEKNSALGKNIQVPGLRKIAGQEIRQGVFPEIETLVTRVIRERKNRQCRVGGYRRPLRLGTPHPQ